MQRVVMWIAIIAAVVLAVLNVVAIDAVEPDEVYEMTNRNIRWYYAGK